MLFNFVLKKIIKKVMMLLVCIRLNWIEIRIIIKQLCQMIY